jgi:hypothetical protein
MNPFGLPESPHYDIDVFTGNSVIALRDWQTWRKPKNRSMAHIFILGSGGGGGNGAIGANSTAAGGGGGGGGAQTSLLIPLIFLPDQLFISVAIGSNGAGIASYVCIEPDSTANSVVGYANGGAVGGNAAGASAGALGGGSGVSVVAQMPFGWPFVQSVIAGQNGVAGGTTGNAANLTYPVTGFRGSGGTGGGGLPAAGVAGTNGGKITLPSAPAPFPDHPQALGSATATDPAANGCNGYTMHQNGLFIGGGGGASTHGTATGAGLQQSSGGQGGFGSGGGGMGGALTGSAAGVKAQGGNGLVIITCF